jgi:hypothetical protein
MRHHFLCELFYCCAQVGVFSRAQSDAVVLLNVSDANSSVTHLDRRWRGASTAFFNEEAVGDIVPQRASLGGIYV